jgi:hypothetical protein
LYLDTGQGLLERPRVDETQIPVTIKANAKPWNNCGGSPKIAAEKIAVNNGMKFAKKAATVGPAPFTPKPQQR